MRLAGLTVSLAILCGTSCGAPHFRYVRGESGDLLFPPIRRATPDTVSAAHYRMHSPYVETGWLDLRAGMRLRVIAPITRAGETLSVTEAVTGPDGAVDARSNAIGFETAYYVVEANADGEGLRLRLQSATARIDGQPMPLAAPERARLELAPSLSHFRLFLKKFRSESDQEIALIASRREIDLAGGTQAIAARCADGESAGVGCILPSRGMAISPETGVRLNGNLVYAPLGANLGELLRTYAAPPSALATLRIWRPQGSRLVPIDFDRNRRDVMRLLLNGGDVIRW